MDFDEYFNDRSEEMKDKSQEELLSGYTMINIINDGQEFPFVSEGVWVWITPEDKKKYNDDTYTGKLKGILCNNPILYGVLLHFGIEVQIECKGDKRGELDAEWINSIIKKIMKDMDLEKEEKEEI